MEMIAVESTNVESIGFRDWTKTLVVKFKSGPSFYRYTQEDPASSYLSDVFDRMMEPGASIGREAGALRRAPGIICTNIGPSLDALDVEVA